MLGLSRIPTLIPFFIWTFLALNPVRILPLSSFHEPIHVRGYFLVSDLRIYLRAIDVCVSHHLAMLLIGIPEVIIRVPNECLAI